MRALIRGSKFRGNIGAPASKSYTLRALMCAALANGQSEIVSPLISDDTEAARDVLGKVGITIQDHADSWLVTGDHFHQPDSDLYCRDSAGTLRFMTALCSKVPGKCRLTAGPSLARRPIGTLIQALRQIGVDCSSQGGIPPVVVSGGELKGGITELPGNISSQFVSALLLAAPLSEKGLTIMLTSPPESKPYILMTLDCMQNFGVKAESSSDLTRFSLGRQSYRPARYRVEGDWSSASYLLAMGVVGGEVEVVNLNLGSLQADRKVLDLLKRMAADIRAQENNTIVAKKSGLKAVTVDLSDCIDLLPTMAVLAAIADGTSVLTGISRARIKESDRIAAMSEGLKRMGIETSEDTDCIRITGGTPGSAIIDSKGDHRIAMAFSILGALTEETNIDGAECVAKTFPAFWDIYKNLGGEVTLNGK